MKKRKTDVGTVTYTYFSDEKSGESKIRAHCHDRYEILYVPKGSGVCIIEGVRYQIKPQTLIVLPPLTYHCLDIDPVEKYERHIVLFTKDDVPLEMQESIKIFDCDSLDDGYFCAYNVDAVGLLSALNRFKEEISLPDFEKIQYFRFLLSQLLLYVFVQKNRAEYVRNESELGSRVIRYLGECITKNITLEHLEKYFFVSKFHLCRAFKKHNGISIHGYINNKRVMYAKKLIDAGESACVAADKVGYSDYSAFYRAFVKIVGKSPTQKRREETL